MNIDVPPNSPHPLGLDFGTDFASLGEYLREHPETAARLRSGRYISIPLSGATADERMTELHDIAREFGTAVDWNGTCFATSVRFGSVTLEAHHNPASFIQVQERKAAAA